MATLIMPVDQAVAETANSNKDEITKYTIDKAHSRIGFKIRHLMISNVLGKFGDFDGEIKFNPNQIDKSSTSATISVSSIDTDNSKRDDHLRSPDFFAAKDYPQIKFESKKTTSTGDKSFTLLGDLTMRGVTKPITLDVTYSGPVKDFAGDNKVGFVATTTLNRKDFGLTWNKILEAGGVAVGEEVKVEIELEATEG
jgi:polyisoprenoid-binding protein YceI